jgi:hypothetical protein
VVPLPEQPVSEFVLGHMLGHQLEGKAMVAGKPCITGRRMREDR